MHWEIVTPFYCMMENRERMIMLHDNILPLQTTPLQAIWPNLLSAAWAHNSQLHNQPRAPRPLCITRGQHGGCHLIKPRVRRINSRIKHDKSRKRRLVWTIELGDHWTVTQRALTFKECCCSDSLVPTRAPMSPPHPAPDSSARSVHSAALPQSLSVSQWRQSTLAAPSTFLQISDTSVTADVESLLHLLCDWDQTRVWRPSPIHLTFIMDDILSSCCKRLKYW